MSIITLKKNPATKHADEPFQYLTDSLKFSRDYRRHLIRGQKCDRAEAKQDEADCLRNGFKILVKYLRLLRTLVVVTVQACKGLMMKYVFNLIQQAIQLPQ
ncbi:hypothetical protein FGO68_gene4535 [Halteria grandinella]|uniref:Uncharacterized protein n=1 Tax=Halteria grandinella TaxID=5974 RepID=A0A8J8P4W3_HALGN|nr:hypothetical protein FGO68_gene4535 [Halteria grandinella]